MSTAEDLKKSCQCAVCKSACQRRAGWFKPDEVLQLAEKMGVTLQELFDKHLAVDWFEADEDFPEDVFILAPANANTSAGDMYSSNPTGQCDFFKDGKCSIHELGKPFECKAYYHETEKGHSRITRKEIVQAWATPENQKMVADLLGREPYAESMSIFDALLMF